MENIKVYLDQTITDTADLFEFIANEVTKEKIVSDKAAVINGFKERELEGSTAFEDGFAIPHAKVSGLTKPWIVIVRSKEPILWESMDGQPTTFVIALLIPTNSAQEHLDLLSSIAVKLTDVKFRTTLKAAKTKAALLKTFRTTQKEVTTKTPTTDFKVVAITACVVGVAHTYMAEEKLLNELSKAGVHIRVETQGSKGVGTKLTEQEIKEADLVILATDTNVDKSRFNNKLVYQTHVARVIKEPLKVLSDAKTSATIYQANQDFKTENKRGKQGVIKHILAGISYMIPIIIAGGVLIAASLGIAKAIWGPSASTTGIDNAYPHNPLWAMEQIGAAAFTLMIPILAAFIANSIAGRAAIAPALIGGFVGNDTSRLVPMFGMNAVQTPMGFIGAIIAGLLVGYFTLWVNSWKVPKALRAAMPIFFIPIVGSIGICVLFMYVIGGPIGFVMDKLSAAIEDGYTSEQFGIGLGLGLGLVLGAMAGFDMGGPINKIAFITSSALITSNIYYPMGAMAAAIPVAPLGMGLSAVLFKRFYTKEEQAAGASALIMGVIGISEGAIPFAIRDPKRAIACNVLGSAIAGAIAGAFKVENLAAHGGPIVAILGAVPYGVQTFYFFLAILIGTTITVSVYGIWLVATLGKIGSVKAAYVDLIEAYKLSASEQKQNLVQEIKKLKQAIKNSDSEEEVKQKLVQIDKLKTQFEPIRTTLATQIEKVKTAYNAVVNEEKVGVKTQTSEFKAYLQEQKQVKQTELKNTKAIYIENSADADKFKKRTLKTDYVNEKEQILETYQERITAYQIKMRKNYVDNFNKLV